MAALRVLSVAVASGKAGYVFLEGAALQDWGISVKATKRADEIKAFVQELIDRLRPDVVVTEACDQSSKKGAKARRQITAIAQTAAANRLLDVCVCRPRLHPSKYEQAQDVVSRHPDLTGYLPRRKRRFFDFEPRNMIVFEAVVLAEAVVYGPPEMLAAAMG